MRLLLDLITSLSGEELSKLESLRLRGKQASVMHLVTQLRTSGRSATESEIAGLGLSRSHLYEISSVVLTKCYGLLVPGGGIELLEFLTYKNCSLQFNQELRKQRKQYMPGGGAGARSFYFTAFELLNRFTYNLIDTELIDEYGKLYESCEGISAEDSLAIAARKLQTRQARILSEGKNFTADRIGVLEEFTALERSAKTSAHPYLCYWVYSGLAWYWQHLGLRAERTLEYIQLALPYASKLQGYIFRDTAVEMQLRHADALFITGDTQRSHETFEKIYASLRPDHALMRRNYFLFRYLEVLIYNGRYDKAEQILRTHFEPQFTQHRTTASATAATLFAIMYLLSGDFPKAKEYLDIGMELNAKINFTLYNEVRNRYVEAAYYYLTGDWDYTLELSNRALQYLRSKHIGLHKHPFGYYFKIIESSVSYYSEGEPFWHKFEDKYKMLNTPAEGLFGKLMVKIRQTPKAKK